MRPEGRWGLDVEDKGNEYVVHAEAPGFEPADFDVQVTGDLVTVKAEKKQESKEKGTQYRSFERSFTLPHGSAADKIEARYHNGVLDLRLPKSPEALGRRIVAHDDCAARLVLPRFENHLTRDRLGDEFQAALRRAYPDRDRIPAFAPAPP